MVKNKISYVNYKINHKNLWFSNNINPTHNYISKRYIHKAVSIPSFTRSTNNDLITHHIGRTILTQILARFNILVSDIFIQEFPQTLQFTFYIFPMNRRIYKRKNKRTKSAISHILKFTKSLIGLVTRKNVNFYFKLAPHLLSNVSILTQWLNLKISTKPLRLKQILKNLNKLYATTTLKGQRRRQFRGNRSSRY